MSENQNLRDKYANLGGNSPLPTKQELTNGIVSDIKSRLEKFKQNKKNESINNQANDFGNIDISKDLLEKFKKNKNPNAHNNNLNVINNNEEKTSNKYDLYSNNNQTEANGNANNYNIQNVNKKEINSKNEIKSFLNRNSNNNMNKDSNENPNNISQDKIKDNFFNIKEKDNAKLNNINNFLNNNSSNSNQNNINNFNNIHNETNLNNTLNYLSGNTVTPNIFGQNFTSNNNNNHLNNNLQKESSNQININNTSKLNDISILNNYNTINPEKDKLDNSFRDLNNINKNRVNSRLESLKEQYEIFSTNKINAKDELDISTSIIKEKMNKKSNNLSSNIPNNLSNLNTNNIINSSNVNNSNKISIITPASNRDCGVFESNFVLKTDKRSFLLNDHALSKRTTSEDKKDIIEEKRNMILDCLNVGKDSKRNQSSNRAGDKDINERFKLNQNKIKDKIQNFVFELDNLTNTQQQNPVYKENRSNTNLSTILERTTNKNNLSSTGLSNLTSFNSNDYSSNLNSTILQTNTNSNKKNVPLPNKSIFPNKNNNSSNFENKFNCKSTKNNDVGNFSGLGINYNIGSSNNITSSLKFEEGISKIKKEDIRNLANRIRFSTQEELKRIDEGLIEELINLSKTISKVFKDLNVSNYDMKL